MWSTFLCSSCGCLPSGSVNKMNFRHLPPSQLTAPSDSVSRLQTKQPLSPMRWLGHQHKLLWRSLHTMEENFPNNSQQQSATGCWSLSKLKLSFIETRMSWGEATNAAWIISKMRNLFPDHWDKNECRAAGSDWDLLNSWGHKCQSSKIRNQWVAAPLSKQIPSWLKIWRMPPWSNDNNENNKTF